MERPTCEDLMKLGIKQPHAWRLSHGQRKPSIQLAARIERELGFPASGWADGPEPVVEAA